MVPARNVSSHPQVAHMSQVRTLSRAVGTLISKLAQQDSARAVTALCVTGFRRGLEDQRLSNGKCVGVRFYLLGWENVSLGTNTFWR